MRKSVFMPHVLQAAQQRGGTLRDWLAKTRELGFEGLECRYAELAPDPEDFAAMLAEVGLEIACVPYFFEFHKGVDREKVKKVVSDVARAGGRKLLAIPGKYCDEQPDALERMVEGLGIAVEEAEKLGITVALEDFDDVKSPCCSAAGLQYFFDCVPALKFNLDTGNFLCMDQDVLEQSRPLMARITHVHLKDWSLEPLHPQERPFCTPGGTELYPSPVGQGVVPMEGCIAMAKDAGYEGFCSAEHYGAADQWDYIVKSAMWMNQYL